jgi:hypothetical protein
MHTRWHTAAEGKGGNLELNRSMLVSLTYLFYAIGHTHAKSRVSQRFGPKTAPSIYGSI